MEGQASRVPGFASTAPVSSSTNHQQREPRRPQCSPLQCHCAALCAPRRFAHDNSTRSVRLWRLSLAPTVVVHQSCEEASSIDKVLGAQILWCEGERRGPRVRHSFSRHSAGAQAVEGLGGSRGELKRKQSWCSAGENGNGERNTKSAQPLLKR